MNRLNRYLRGAAALSASAALSAVMATTAAAAMNIVGNRYDNNRSGANLTETTLSPATVSSSTFGKLWAYTVDGAIFAQPLYVQGVTVTGATAAKNVLYVATMHDVVYAFDADNPGTPLWTHDYRATGITPGTPFDTVTASDGMGIIGTPVIDAPNYKMYFVAETMENSAYVQRLHVLDIRSGIDLGSTVITAAANGQTFSPEYQSQRPGLALSSGQVWIAFGSTIPGDFSPWHGWVMTYNAATLAQTGVFVTTTGSGGGIWQSGGAPAVDSAGNVYYLTGNGTGQAYDGINNFQESLLKFAYNNGLTLADWYTDATWATLDQYDLDLTVNGPMLVPGTSLLAFGGKVGISTVLNTSKSLGHLTANNAQVVQQIQTGPVQNPAGNDGDRIIGLTYWQRPTNSLMFAWPGFAALTSYTFNGTTFALSQQLSNNLFGEPSAAVSVSANGSTVGSGIVWTAHNQASGRAIGQAAVVEAYNADNLTSKLWSSTLNVSRDDVGSIGRFVIPVVNNGKMYMATGSGSVVVYGLLGGASTPLAQTITFNALAAQKVGATVTLGATASSGLAVSYTSTTGVCTVSGSNATMIAAGTCTITAAQSGNATYAAATPVAQSFAVTAGGTFTLTPKSTSLTVTPPVCFFIFCFGGVSATDAISIAPVNGFTGSVSFSITGLPSGVSAAFNPAAAAAGASTTLTLTPASSAGTGTAALTIKGTSGTGATAVSVTTPITLKY